MAVPEVNKKLLTELVEMGFPLARATRALHYSGNIDLEAAINWVVDHENDPDIDEMPLVLVNIDIDTSQPSITEQVKLKAQELRDQARRRREEEAKRQEIEREKERIRAGKELQEAKQLAEENERKRVLAMQKVEKNKEKRYREKIQQKLQQDKLERRRWLGLPLEGPESVKATRPAMQEKRNLLTVKSATLPVKSATKAELMRDCLKSLRRNHKDNDAKVKRAFHTLLVYARNVAWNPNEEKFRKIRVSNPAFQDRVGAFEEGVKFLELCGFERVEGGKFLYLPRDKVDMEVLISAGAELQSALTNPFFGLLSST
ncbi:hypothetical protein LguiA_011727 [Lonicera macranthoides]